MKLYELLKEESIGDATKRWTPKPMDDDQIIQWCDDFASRFMSKKVPLFRGTYRHLSGLLNTKNLNRTSANTSNHYTFWLDNHPDWSKFPKRRASIIATDSTDIADWFGDRYLIIPSDDSHIGICPDGDLWYSFTNTFGSSVINNLKDLNNALRNCSISAEDWPSMVKDIKDYDPKKFLTTGTYFKYYNASKKLLNKWINQLNATSLYDALVKALDPDANGFKQCDAWQIPKTGDREIWVSGEVIQIEFATMSKELKKYFNGKGLI